MSLLDTTIIIDLLQQRRHEAGAVSIISLIEVLRGLEDGKRAKAKQLLEDSFRLINLDNAVIEAYCHLYRQMKRQGTPLPDADLLIAATAITHNMTLRTNDKHFETLRPLGLKST